MSKLTRRERLDAALLAVSFVLALIADEWLVAGWIFVASSFYFEAVVNRLRLSALSKEVERS